MARNKHSSLFCSSIRALEKSFKTFTRVFWDGTFFFTKKPLKNSQGHKHSCFIFCSMRVEEKFFIKLAYGFFEQQISSKVKPKKLTMDKQFSLICRSIMA
jgi:hypothetical protein